jgi:hypothetical protein
MTTNTTTNPLRFKTKALSVPDELYWYNTNTDWNSLNRKEFRAIMIRMEAITAQHYDDVCATGRSNRSAAVKKFWADEWGCEYLPESRKWINLTTGAIIESETEKKAKRAAKRAEKASKQVKKQHTPKEQVAQYNDEEEEVYVQAAQMYQSQQPSQQPSQQQYDDWFDAEEEAYAEAYAKARAQEEQREQKEQKEQREAQAYLDSLALDYQSEEQEQEQQQRQSQERIVCQPVLYIEELTDVQGDPDWRAYIYYDERIRRFVLKGTRRSLRATSRKTVYPEVKLCFRSSRELANYLRSSTDNAVNVTMFAMPAATVRDATFAEIYALPARGCKTELFGYDRTRPSYSTWVDDLCILRDVDASHSNFAAF